MILFVYKSFINKKKIPKNIINIFLAFLFIAVSYAFSINKTELYALDYLNFDFDHSNKKYKHKLFKKSYNLNQINFTNNIITKYYTNTHLYYQTNYNQTNKQNKKIKKILYSIPTYSNSKYLTYQKNINLNFDNDDLIHDLISDNNRINNFLKLFNNNNSISKAQFIYDNLQKYRWHRDMWVYGFWNYHLYSFSERAWFFSLNKDFNGVFVKTYDDSKKQNYHEYTSKINMVKDLLSLFHLFTGPFNASVEARHYYENTSDSDTKKNSKMTKYLDRVLTQHSSFYTLNSYLIRLGFNAFFTSLVMFDLGRTDKGWSYFLKSLILGEFKILSAPNYARKIKIKVDELYNNKQTTAYQKQILYDTLIPDYNAFNTNLRLIMAHRALSLNYQLLF